MESYALAAIQAYAARRVEAEIIFLRGAPRVVAVPIPPPDEIRVRLAAIGEALRNARTLGDYPRKPAGPAACRALRCGYVPRCWGH